MRRGWRTVVVGAAVLLALMMFAGSIRPPDVEAIVYSGAIVVALLVVRWRPRLGAVAIGLLSLNAAAWMLPAALSSLRHPSSFEATMLPAALAVTGLAGAVGAAGTLSGRAGRRGPIYVAVCAVAAIAVVAVLHGRGPTEVPPTADIELETRNMAFDRDEITTRAGEITVRLRNHDLFWHTFTVPDLGLDLRVPSKVDRTATFTARPGTYEFICAIPGHPQAGMRGTLTVR